MSSSEVTAVVSSVAFAALALFATVSYFAQDLCPPHRPPRTPAASRHTRRTAAHPGEHRPGPPPLIDQGPL
ncbi:hypothetical protein C8250_009175 [Streptomyces sp. So13.3]|uniref:hypothetical protein n=1 Tax=Streptomyces sp. So13.3 TaxID=2136173 RepID=UPI0011071AD8|nr:hypothetical protein [Streptomyces sp. So13.3]QNA72053.1 hypothetical protein C8250_009175 [Streptomyces sp. So13.3]